MRIRLPMRRHGLSVFSGILTTPTRMWSGLSSIGSLSRNRDASTRVLTIGYSVSATVSFRDASL